MIVDRNKYVTIKFHLNGIICWLQNTADLAKRELNVVMNHHEDNKYEIKDKKIAPTVDNGWDPTSLFDHDNTKKVLFREEPKIARLSQQNVRLIDTTAVLFLQNLLSVTSSAASGQSECIITLRDLRSAISSIESLHFLKASVDSINESNQIETPYISAIKAKRHSTKGPNNKRVKKAKSVLGNHRDDEEGVKVALAVSGRSNASAVDPTREIVPDEDDYD